MSIKKKVPKEISDIFLYHYLDEKKLSVNECYKLTQEWTKKLYPELIEEFPDEDVFVEMLDIIPNAIQTLLRADIKEKADIEAEFQSQLKERIESMKNIKRR